MDFLSQRFPASLKPSQHSPDREPGHGFGERRVLDRPGEFLEFPEFGREFVSGGGRRLLERFGEPGNLLNQPGVFFVDPQSGAFPELGVGFVRAFAGEFFLEDPLYEKKPPEGLRIGEDRSPGVVELLRAREPPGGEPAVRRFRETDGNREEEEDADYQRLYAPSFKPLTPYLTVSGLDC